MNQKLKILLVILTISLSACRAPQGMQIRDAWARPGVTGGNSAVYLTINNPSAQEDSLNKAECSAASAVELHMSKMDEQGNMTMEMQKSIPIPAQSTVQLQPGGLHIMLLNLKQDLNPGGKITVTLTFEKSGTLQLEVPIRQP